MTHEEFNKGYKLLLRFFKEKGRLKDFKEITAKNNPQYKNKLEKAFEVHKHTWYDYFSYTTYIGTEWKQYNDPKMNTFRTEWRILIAENNVI